MIRCLTLLFLAGLVMGNASLSAAEQTLLVEAESFDDLGGWSLDTQFINEMGSPYLLAHGIGRPVADASTKIKIKEAGKYRVFVRTKDWVARWKAPGTPGKFQLLIDGQPLAANFGTESANWFWQSGGEIELTPGEHQLALHDLTGFDGRCDAIVLTTSPTPPPVAALELAKYRRQHLGLAETPTIKKGYDLVVVGGGYSGIGAALSAARMGCKVALIQDRGVLGGNGSSEVRVWSMGLIRRGKYPRIGEIVEEFCDHAKKSPGTAQEFEDDKKEKVVLAEEKIDLFLNTFADGVKQSTKSRIDAVTGFNVKTGEQFEFQGKLFVDATGHGTIGALADAAWEMTDKGRMGMSNMWTWAEESTATKFPETPWALPLAMKDFPYPVDHHGQWFWESGYDKDPLNDAEAIRDWNLRAVFGAFNAMKNGDGAEKHKSAVLTWVAFIGGPRESRRLLGDVVLTQEDVVNKREFPDGCVPSTWSIDLHYPKKQFAQKFEENPFISIAVHDQRIDRAYGYPVPYRCFYSKNINNLFMAGRNISVTHEALGTTRVMKTCGMMGEVVGKAAYLCTLHDCQPRDVYESYWKEMDVLLNLPGKARRESISGDVVIPADAMSLPGPPGLDPAKLDGVVIDNRDAKVTGNWTSGSGLNGYVGYEYLYAQQNTGAKIAYPWKAGEEGLVSFRLIYGPHENRGTKVPVTIRIGETSKVVTVDMTKTPTGKDGSYELGQFPVRKGEAVTVELGTENAGGFVHADAVQLVKINAP
ncbi:MAG: NADH-dependent oxidoreductase [Planctomyces sp.]|nr:NADH-dependent oxidoreductase [Planctomyces sp.]